MIQARACSAVTELSGNCSIEWTVLIAGLESAGGPPGA